MSHLTLQETLTTIGLDLGDRYTHFCVLDPSGEELEAGRIRTTPEAVAARFASLPRHRVVMEVGTHSPWISRLIAEAGHEVLVLNAYHLRLIAGSVTKDDRHDAEQLARLALRAPDLLKTVRHRGAESQRQLTLLRARDALVRARTLLINSARSLTKSLGGRLPKCSAESFARKAAPDLPQGVRAALRPMLDTAATLSRRIKKYDQRIAVMVRRDPVMSLLSTVPGVGPLTAAAFVLTIEEPERFPDSRELGAYVGLVPKRRDSGDRSPQLAITKHGDRFLRRLLVGAAQYILGPFGPDTALRAWGLRLADRGGAAGKKRAVVAVARKLATLLHRMWVTGKVYEPKGIPTRGRRGRRKAS